MIKAKNCPLEANYLYEDYWNLFQALEANYLCRFLELFFPY